MLRLVMGQLGLSLDDKTLQFWRKKLFETTLHLTKFVADSRRVFHKSSFWRPRRLVQGYFWLNLWFCLQRRSKVITNCSERGNDLYNLTPCLFTGILVSSRQKLSSRNQGFNRAPGSWKSHFGIGSRSENSMNGTTPPLYPFPLAFQPVNEAPCRPLSPQPKTGVFASHVGGGGSGDCQSLADIPCNVVGGGPVNPSGERGVDHCCG